MATSNYFRKKMMRKMTYLSSLPVFILLFSMCSSKDSMKEPQTTQDQESIIVGLYDDFLADPETNSHYDSLPEFLGLNRFRTDLSKLERNRDTALIASFYQKMFHELKDDTPIEYYPYEDFSSWLYTIDINNDGLKDIIYSGYTQGEPEITIIFIKKGGGFYKVFSEYQYLTDIRFSEGKVSRFVLDNPGCCDDHQVVISEYAVKHENGWPQFTVLKTHGYTTITEIPKVLFETPLRFSIREAFVSLATTTDNRSFNDQVEADYHFIGKYKEGAIGIALAGKRNNSGEWIFVRMDPSSKLVGVSSYSRFVDHPTHIYGWIPLKDIGWTRKNVRITKSGN